MNCGWLLNFVFLRKSCWVDKLLNIFVFFWKFGFLYGDCCFLFVVFEMVECSLVVFLLLLVILELIYFLMVFYLCLLVMCRILFFWWMVFFLEEIKLVILLKLVDLSFCDRSFKLCSFFLLKLYWIVFFFFWNLKVFVGFSLFCIFESIKVFFFLRVVFNLLLNKLIVFNILKFCLELELVLVCDFWGIFLLDVE